MTERHFVGYMNDPSILTDALTRMEISESLVQQIIELTDDDEIHWKESTEDNNLEQTDWNVSIVWQDGIYIMSIVHDDNVILEAYDSSIPDCLSMLEKLTRLASRVSGLTMEQIRKNQAVHILAAVAPARWLHMCKDKLECTSEELAIWMLHLTQTDQIMWELEDPDKPVNAAFHIRLSGDSWMIAANMPDSIVIEPDELTPETRTKIALLIDIYMGEEE